MTLPIALHVTHSGTKEQTKSDVPEDQGTSTHSKSNKTDSHEQNNEKFSQVISVTSDRPMDTEAKLNDKATCVEHDMPGEERTDTIVDTCINIKSRGDTKCDTCTDEMTDTEGEKNMNAKVVISSDDRVDTKDDILSDKAAW